MPSEVRVFVSSTFRDMHAERDHLVTVVFPELRERLERLGLQFFDVDLRWGVPEIGVDGERANSWRYCKQWIDRVEPFFICLLGERYGWVPEAREIEDEDERAEFEGMSITEMEIRYAVLTGRRRRRSFFYSRSTPVPTNAPAEVYGEFVDADKLDRRNELMKQIRDSRRPMRSYACEWTGSGFSQLDAFGAIVLEDLWSGVLRDDRYVSKKAWRKVLGRQPDGDPLYDDESRPIPEEFWERLVQEAKPPTLDPLDAEAQQMAAFAALRLRWFKGRSRQLQSLHDFATGEVSDEDSRLCVVRAVPGQGKSALLAKLADEFADSPELVLTHFVGATARSADLRSLLERLVQELDRAGVPRPDEEEPGQDLGSLKRRLAARLQDYDSERRIVLVVDAVNQLASGHGLTWIPSRLGSGVRVVLSCIDEPTLPSGSPEARVLSALAARRPRPLQVELPGLDEADVREIVVEYLQEYCKVLDTDQIEAICRMEQARNPLYLLVMLNELRTLGGNDMQKIVRTLIADLPRDRPDTVRLFDWMLERLEVFGVGPVRQWCTCLSLGRVGMSSRELSELLADDLGETGARTAPLVERGIRGYLQRRGGQLDFFHGQLRQAVKERYLRDEDTGLEAHRTMARYFQRKADPSSEREWDGRYERGLSELPYHLAEAGCVDNLHETLTDSRFLERKAAEVGIVEYVGADGETTTTYTGIFALEDDFELALARFGGDEPIAALTPVKQAIELSAHVVVRDPDQLAGQLVGRLADSPVGPMQSLIAALRGGRKSPWLCPRLATLYRPGAGVARTWRILERAPACRLLLSADTESIAIITGTETMFVRLRDGVTVPREEAEKAFPKANWHLWQSDLPEQFFTDQGMDQTWRASTPPEGIRLACVIQRLTNGLRTNPSYRGGVALLGTRLDDSEHFLEASTPDGSTYLASGLTAPALSTDGRHAICGGVRGALKIWDIASGALVLNGQLGRSTIAALASFPDGDQIAFLTEDGVLGYGTPAPRMPGQPEVARLGDPPVSLWLSPGGLEAILADVAGSVSCWDTRTGARLYLGKMESSFHPGVKVTGDYRYAVGQGRGEDFYDGFFLVVHDLEHRTRLCSLESYQRGWSVEYVVYDGRPLVVADGLVWDDGPKELTHVVDLSTGAVAKGVTPPAGTTNIGWATPRLDDNSGAQCEFPEEGRYLRVRLPGASQQPLLFTPDDRIVGGAIAADSSCIAIACLSGQLHFLDILPSSQGVTDGGSVPPDGASP